MDSQLWTITFNSENLLSGSYPILRRGDTVEFAVEVWTDEDDELVAIQADGPLERTAEHVGRGWHTVTGVVTYQTDDAEASLADRSTPSADDDTPERLFVLDFGILGYKTYDAQEYQGLAPGTWLTGRALLSVDSFPYVWQYAGLPGIPPLVYTWKIERIHCFTRDRMWEVDATDSQRSSLNSGGPAYLLTVARLDVPPRFASRTSTESKWSAKDAQ